MKATISVDLSQFLVGMEQREAAISRGIARALEDIAGLGQTYARAFLRPYRAPPSGRLEAAIKVEVDAANRKARVYIDDAEAPYGKYLEGGTGIYGPKGAPIVPRSSSVLVWTDRATGERRFARAVSGTRPRRFMTRAFRTLEGVAQAEASRIMLSELAKED